MKYVRTSKITVVMTLAALFFISCTEKKVELSPDENNMIFFFKEENHNTSIREKLVLTTKNVHDVIHYINTHYPEFKFDKQEYKNNESDIEHFVNSFNTDGPHLCSIYMSGIPKDAGYSSVLSWLNGYLDTDEPELYSFHFFIDEEYSDGSGVSFSDFFITTNNSDILHLFRQQYMDSDDYYWSVTWPLNELSEDILTKEEQTEILTSFLTQFRASDVFLNIDLDWFENAYTAIERGQQMYELLWEQ